MIKLSLSPVGVLPHALHLISQIVWQLPGHLVGQSVPVVVTAGVFIPNLLPVTHLYTHCKKEIYEILIISYIPPFFMNKLWLIWSCKLDLKYSTDTYLQRVSTEYCTQTLCFDSILHRQLADEPRVWEAQWLVLKDKMLHHLNLAEWWWHQFPAVGNNGNMSFIPTFKHMLLFLGMKHAV